MPPVEIVDEELALGAVAGRYHEYRHPFHSPVLARRSRAGCRV
jgi:hypothetical protein